VGPLCELWGLDLGGGRELDPGMAPRDGPGGGVPIPRSHEARPTTAPSRGRRWAMVPGSPQARSPPQGALERCASDRRGPSRGEAWPCLEACPSQKVLVRDEGSASRGSRNLRPKSSAEDENGSRQAPEWIPQKAPLPHPGASAEGGDERWRLGQGTWCPGGTSLRLRTRPSHRPWAASGPGGGCSETLGCPRKAPRARPAVVRVRENQVEPTVARAQGPCSDAAHTQEPQGAPDFPIGRDADKRSGGCEEGPGPRRQAQGEAPWGPRPGAAPSAGVGAEGRIRAMVRALEARSQGLVAHSLRGTFSRPTQAPQPREDPGEGATERPAEGLRTAECITSAPQKRVSRLWRLCRQ